MSLLFRGRNSFNSVKHCRISTRRIGKKRMKIRTVIHTIPNHLPPEMDVLPKTFLQIILFLAGVSSSTSLKQHRRPLPSLLSVSFSMLVLLLMCSTSCWMWRLCCCLSCCWSASSSTTWSGASAGSAAAGGTTNRKQTSCHHTSMLTCSAL